MTWGSKNCDACSTLNSVQKIISNNTLLCRCMNCGESYELSLLKIRKELIYLDQNIFSNAFKRKFKRKQTRFDLILTRLDELTRKQLISCPYSELHDIESHQMTDGSKELFSFLKSMSRRNKFKLSCQIKEQQIINAFVAFLDGTSDISTLKINEAIDPSFQDWDQTLLVDTDFSIGKLIKPDITRKGKESFVEQLIAAIPMFKKMNYSISTAFEAETKTHAN